MITHAIPQATSPLAAWLDYLEHLHNKTIELGLVRVQKVAKRCGLLNPAPTVLTVAGTNGKGTTCCTLEAILMAAGYRVGVYSSPHLLRYTERVRIQGKELPEKCHSKVFAAIEKQRGDISLTYFEYSTLAALALFKQQRVDVAILEVGLGGRLDATNIVDPSVSAITSIALDHTDWLGDNRESIGREKAGIFRYAIPAVVGEPEMPQSIVDVAAEKGTLLYCRNKQWRFVAKEDDWCWQDETSTLSHLPLPKVPLENAATALAILRKSGLNVSEQAIREGLTHAILPGRFQTVAEKPKVILDVAHNPHAAEYLSKQLCQLLDKQEPRPQHVRAVVAMLADKDIAGTLAYLKPWVTDWYCAPLDGERGASVGQVSENLDLFQAFPSVEQAWQKAMDDSSEQDIVIVCGSFHTVAQVMTVLVAGEDSGK